MPGAHNIGDVQGIAIWKGLVGGAGGILTPPRTERGASAPRVSLPATGASKRRAVHALIVKSGTRRADALRSVADLEPALPPVDGSGAFPPMRR